MSETPAPLPRPRSRFALNIRANLLAGVLTVIPLFAVWFVLSLLVTLLSDAGHPLIIALAAWIEPTSPSVAEFLRRPEIDSVLAVIAILLILYVVGLLATFVLGQQLIGWFEGWMARIPIVQTIYGGTKQLLSALQTKPGGGQRVVLIAFPHAGMRAVGIVMKTFRDATTGRELAAVYVPTTPNPTSGYLEIVPLEDLVPTDMTMDQAMTMIISGGAVSPETLRFDSDRRPPA